MHHTTRLMRWTSSLLFALGAGHALACAPVPKAVIDIEANRYYTDAHNSIIDPVLKARNVASVKPIDEFLDAIARSASAYQAAPAAKQADAQCALDWMQGWAEQKALLGKMSSNQAWYTRKWTLGGLALSYAKLKPAAGAAQRQAIEAWLRTLADLTLAHADASTGTRNNHYYWEGLAVTAVGAVTGEPRYLAWGRKVFDHAMSQVAPDGSLPQEMARASKALHYHLFAVTPLVMIASILDIQSPRLDQLVRFTLDGVADPAAIEKATGVAQERPHEPLTWKAIYDRHRTGLPPSPPATNWQPRLGGDLSVPNPLEHVAPSTSAQPLHNIYGRKHVLLDGRWSYIVDPYETGYYNYRHQPYDQTPGGAGGFYDDRKPKDKGDIVEYSFDGAPTLAIPGDWNSQDAKLENYEGTVWMRQQFNAAPQPGKRYVLYFGAVNYEAHVYLNGRKLGSHKGGFTPFQFDVTGRLNAGRNTVIVKADNTRHQDDIPTVSTDWWNYGGITRDVLLAEVPETHIADYQVQLAQGDLRRIDGYVRVDGPQRAQEVTLAIPAAGIRTTMRTGADGRAAFSIPLAAHQLRYWSPEEPTLYNVTLSSATDRVDDRIGFRTIVTRGRDILLNGHPVFLRGVSLHDENPLIPGRLRGAGDMRMLLQWAKDLNCNYVRLAHYPHSEEMTRLADEMDLLVWAEVPVYWTISWDNPAVFDNARQQLTDMIVRDRNRASVVIWSIGNETPVSPARTDFMTRLAATVRGLDRTRLVAAALEVHRKGAEITLEDPLAEQLDLISFNEYAGWYWASNRDMLQNRFTITADKPVIITEFGADALGGYHADADTRWSEEYQDQLYRNQFQLLDAIPGLRGMTPWVLVDFRSPRRPHPYFQDFWNRKGLLTESGKPKLAFHTLKAYYEGKKRQYK